MRGTWSQVVAETKGGALEEQEGISAAWLILNGERPRNQLHSRVTLFEVIDRFSGYISYMPDCRTVKMSTCLDAPAHNCNLGFAKNCPADFRS